MTKPELALYASADGTGRAYRHPFRKREDGSAWDSPSVTTILKKVDKSGITQWAVDQVVKYLIDNPGTILNRTEEGAYNTARWRWKDARDERAEVGTGIHETIEAEHTGSWNFPELDDEQLLIMEQWRKFKKRYQVEPLLSEFTVWNFTHDYAGTADGWWNLTDLVTGEMFSLFIDLKTSNNTWPEHRMQLAAIANAEVIMVKDDSGEWHEREIPDIDGAAIVHLKADTHELIRIDKDELSLRYDEFLAYRKLWGLEQQLKELEKSKVVKYGKF